MRSRLGAWWDAILSLGMRRQRYAGLEERTCFPHNIQGRCLVTWDGMLHRGTLYISQLHMVYGSSLNWGSVLMLTFMCTRPHLVPGKTSAYTR